MTFAICTLVGAIAVAIWWYRYSTTPTQDGGAYLVVAAGHPCPPPFRWRRLQCLLRPWCRGVTPQPASWSTPFQQAPKAVAVWTAASWTALAVSSGLVGVYAEQNGVSGLLAAVLWVSLPWFRGLVRCPVLTDQVAMMLALAASVVPWWAAIPLALLAGRANERAPMFAAVFAMSPVPLVGLLAPAWAWWRAPECCLLPWLKPERYSPWGAMRRYHGGAALYEFVLPWGACLLATGNVSIQLAAAMVMGYGQLVVASDRARLFQWGAPVAVVAACQVLGSAPAWVVGLAVVAHVASPWAERQK